MAERHRVDGWKMHFGYEFSAKLAKAHFDFPQPKEGQRALYYSEKRGGDGESLATTTVACIHLDVQTGIRRIEYAVIGDGAAYPDYSRWITVYDYQNLTYEVPELNFKKEGMIAVIIGTYKSDKLWRKRKLAELLAETGTLFDSEEFAHGWKHIPALQTLDMIEQSQYYEVSPGKWVEGDRSMLLGYNPIIYHRDYFANPDVPMRLYSLSPSNPGYGKMRETIQPRVIEVGK